MTKPLRRRVRRWVVPVSRGVPFALVQGVIRRDLNERKHTILEETWHDAPGYYTVTEFRDGDVSHRTVSVRYLTGGMRYGFGPTVDWSPPGPDVVEFPPRGIATGNP